MSNSKAILRQHFLQTRKSIPESGRVIASKNAADNFFKSINIKGLKSIAFYYPVNGEIDPRPLMSGILLAYKDIICALPTVIAKDSHLLFHQWKIGDEVKNNSFYSQLIESTSQENNVVPDMIIVPLIAFDEKCHRLGYGAGFYDRTIAKLREESAGRQNYSLPITVGYAYEYQKSNSPLPADKHDMQLDFIVTDKYVYSK